MKTLIKLSLLFIAFNFLTPSIGYSQFKIKGLKIKGIRLNAFRPKGINRSFRRIMVRSTGESNYFNSKFSAKNPEISNMADWHLYDWKQEYYNDDYIYGAFLFSPLNTNYFFSGVATGWNGGSGYIFLNLDIKIRLSIFAANSNKQINY